MEELRSLLRPEPDPVVADAEGHLFVVADDANVDGRSGRRVFERVGEQVRDDLAERLRIPLAGGIGAGGYLQRDASSLV